MKYAPRIYYTETDKALMWDRCPITSEIEALFTQPRPIPDVSRSLTLPSEPAIRLVGGIRAESGHKL